MIWIKREKVEKEAGHLAFIDLFRDEETGVEYWCYGDKNLVPRLNADGSPYIE